MADFTLQQKQVHSMATKEADKTNNEYKAFQELRKEMTDQLVFSDTYVAADAFAAELIPNELYETIFVRDIRTKSDAQKIRYLMSCLRNNIQVASSREEAKKKMSEFLDCLRNDAVFDGLVKTLEDKVAIFEQDKKEPEVEALKDSDILNLAAGCVHDLATNAFSKGLIADSVFYFIISGGNEAEKFIDAMLDNIGRQIQVNPNVLDTFITKVLDKAGKPISSLGDKLRELAGPSVN